jgi:tripartite-type tricarboxylate transporter receptor subunit TctC
MTFVPYPGNVPAITALLGGHVTVALGNYPEVIEQLRGGKLRALATTSPARVSLLPDLPTVAELGFPRYSAEVWLGLVAPARTPQARIAEIAGWITQAAQVPAVAAKLSAHGLFPRRLCGEEFGAHMRTQHQEYARAIGESGIKAQ